MTDDAAQILEELREMNQRLAALERVTLLGVEDVAALHDISVKTVWRWNEMGILGEPKMVRGKYFWSLEAAKGAPRKAAAVDRRRRIRA